MSNTMEYYLLNYGIGRSVFARYFINKYLGDVGKLLLFYQNWQVVQEGLRQCEVYDVFFKSYGWSLPHFRKITFILLYADLIYIVDHARHYYRLKDAPRIDDELQNYHPINLFV